MTTNTTATKVFRVLGTTDEVTECEHCGRVDLKGTIRLGYLDADGNVESTTYFGAVCGARAAGWTTKEIRKQATAANRAAREAAWEARLAATKAALDEADRLRGTADCPSMPSICQRERRGCVAHGDAPRKVTRDWWDD